MSNNTPKKKTNQKARQTRMIRIGAIILAVLMVSSLVVSFIMSL